MEENGIQINPNANNSNSANASVPDIVNTQTVSTSKPKFPIAAIIGIILFLLIAGSAAGFYIFKQQSLKAVKPTPSPVVQEQTPTPTPDPTADWKTFNGSGFTIKYPSDFAPEKCPQNFGTSFICSDKQDNGPEPLIYFISSDNVAQLPQSANGTNVTLKQEVINGISTYRTSDLPSQSGVDSVYFKNLKGGYVFVSISPHSDNGTWPNEKKFDNLFTQILSTFKFTDSNSTPTPDQTANWKTYSITNQFEFKYPLDQYSVVSGQTNLDYAYPGQLIVKPNDSFIQNVGSNVYNLTITPIVNKNHLTLTNVDTLLGVDNSKNTFPAVPITIGGIKGSRYNNVPGQVDRTEIYIIKSDKNNPDGIIYNLTLRTLNGAKASAENESTLQNILSTFRFTN